VSRYPWGSSPAGERVAAAGGGLAELAAVPTCSTARNALRAPIRWAGTRGVDHRLASAWQPPEAVWPSSRRCPPAARPGTLSGRPSGGPVPVG
jgi:hypothetical protein